MNPEPGHKRVRLPYSRTKTGCLICRMRRKKCDERKPSCLACERNQLICSWPPCKPKGLKHKTQKPPVVQEADKSLTVRGGSEGTCHPKAAPNIQSLQPSVPTIFRHPEASALLDYFTGVTAPRMVGKSHIENPFITYNLRMAMSCTTLQHAILAVGSCHRACSDPSYIVPSKDHYAVALRSLKVSITKWRSYGVIDQMALLASSLTLCWYEVIDANVEGSLYHHLRASGSMLSDLQNDQRCGSGELGFFMEQYAYLATVANISTGRKVAANLIDPAALCYSFTMVNHGSPIYGFMFGYAHRLFEAIYRIRDLVAPYSEIAEGQDQRTKNYARILAMIEEWHLDDGHDPAYELVGRIYQASCIIFLHTSMHGPQDPTDQLYTKVEPYIDIFLESFKSLSYHASSWTTFMWPALIVGSCMRSAEHRQVLAEILCKSTLQMRTVDSTSLWLSLHWENMDKDTKTYGPDGLEKMMTDRGLALCVG